MSATLISAAVLVAQILLVGGQRDARVQGELAIVVDEEEHQLEPLGEASAAKRAVEKAHSQ